MRLLGAAPLQVIREVKAGASYASSDDVRVHIGLGQDRSASLEVQWPDGTRERLDDLAANHRYLVAQGRGAMASAAAVH